MLRNILLAASAAVLLNSHPAKSATIILKDDRTPQSSYDVNEDTEYILDYSISYVLAETNDHTLFRNTGGSTSFHSRGNSYLNLAIYNFNREDGNARAVYNSEGSVKFSQLGNITFSGFYHDQEGGAALLSESYSGSYDDTSIWFTGINGAILFEQNMALGGGAIQSNTSAGAGSLSNGTSTGGLRFENVKGSILFTENMSMASGGAIEAMTISEAHDGASTAIAKGGVAFNNIDGSIQILENHAEEQGGAIHTHTEARSLAAAGRPVSTSVSEGGIAWNGLYGDIVVINNIGKGGGAIMLSTLSLVNGDGTAGHAQSNGSFVFTDSSLSILFMGNYASGSGGSILSSTKAGYIHDSIDALEYNSYGGALGQGEIVFSRISGNISFLYNEALDYGGAIHSHTSAYHHTIPSQEPGQLKEIHSLAKASGGIHFDRIAGSIVFSQNRSANGGALGLLASTELHGHGAGSSRATGYVLFKEISGNITFSYNWATDSGGAIHIASSLSLDEGNDPRSISLEAGLHIQDISGDVLFDNNIADDKGGAVFLTGTDYGPYTGAAKHANSLLLSADGGDIIFKGNQQGGVDDAVLNSIYLEGRSYLDEFRASEGNSVIFFDPVLAENSASETLHLNKSGKEHEYSGTIRFSGASVSTYIQKSGNESFARFESRYNDSLHSIIRQDTILHNGTLQIDNGAILELKSLTVNQAEIKTIENSLLKSDRVQLNEAKVDIMGIATGEHTMEIETPSLSGSLVAYNKNGDLYQKGGLLDSDVSFALMTIYNCSDSSGLSLELGETRTGTDAEGNQGHWNLFWSYGDNEQTLYASWTYTGYIEPSDPGDSDPPTMDIPQEVMEAGEAASYVLNSLWSSKSNLELLARTMRSQVPLHKQLNKEGYYYWVQALADRAEQKSKPIMPGYDYSGTGFALGINTDVIIPNVMLGLAYSRMTGNNENRESSKRNKQKSGNLVLYALFTLDKQENQSLTMDLCLGRNITNNTIVYQLENSYEINSAEWDNDVYTASTRLYWNNQVTESWTVSPFAGLDYFLIKQDNFDETGYKPRHFNNDDFAQISIPLGVSAMHRMPLPGGMQWLNNFGVTYVPDIYRAAPKTTTRFTPGRDSYDFSSHPARHAGRLHWDTALKLDPFLVIFAGYQLEARSEVLFHQFNIGISASY